MIWLEKGTGATKLSRLLTYLFGLGGIKRVIKDILKHPLIATVKTESIFALIELLPEEINHAQLVKKLKAEATKNKNYS